MDMDSRAALAAQSRLWGLTEALLELRASAQVSERVPEARASADNSDGDLERDTIPAPPPFS
jgi:hypothetical protein